MEQKTAVEKLNIVKYGAKRVFEPPNENSNEGHFGAHIGPMRSFHRPVTGFHVRCPATAPSRGRATVAIALAATPAPSSSTRLQLCVTVMTT